MTAPSARPFTIQARLTGCSSERVSLLPSPAGSLLRHEMHESRPPVFKSTALAGFHGRSQWKFCTFLIQCIDASPTNIR